MSFKNKIIKTVSNLVNEFKANEIAYLAMTSKIEIQLRDKIAFSIHEDIGGKYLVCREWVHLVKNKKVVVDLAIISKADGKPICLIEFKAKSVIGYQKEFTDHLSKDVLKMDSIVNDDSVELYYIYFNNLMRSSENIENELKGVVKYFDYINRSFCGPKSLDLENEIKTNWKRNMEVANLGEFDYQQVNLDSGHYYKHKVEIVTFIYGPILKSKINRR